MNIKIKIKLSWLHMYITGLKYFKQNKHQTTKLKEQKIAKLKQRTLVINYYVMSKSKQEINKLS